MSADPKWRDRAACRPGSGHDPQLWFSQSRAKLAAAERICRSCPVLAECRLVGEAASIGVWSGEYHRFTSSGPSMTSAYLEEHGTAAGYSRHTRRHEPPCDRCLIAHRFEEAQREDRQVRV